MCIYIYMCVYTHISATMYFPCLQSYLMCDANFWQTAVLGLQARPPPSPRPSLNIYYIVK